MTSGNHAHVRPEPQEALPREIRVPLDAEAGHRAVEEYRSAAQHSDVEVAVVLACLTYVRHLEWRRSLDTYDLKGGLRIHGLSRDEVQAARGALVYYGGDTGALEDDAMARALSAARAWRDVHEARHRQHVRARNGAAVAEFEDARKRAEACKAAPYPPPQGYGFPR